MPKIHPTACVESGARIADDAEIGPYCVIGSHVSIGNGCRLVSHVVLDGHTDIGQRTVIHPHTSLGSPPQSVHYAGGSTRLVIGADCQIRECVTMNTGTEKGGGLTSVGDGCFFMACSHVAHDCHVGNRVVMANYAVLGGHCVVGDNVFIAGLAGAHQFCRIGSYAMIGASTVLRGDLIPYGLASGHYAELAGLNRVGMKRSGMSRQSIHAVRAAYRMLFSNEGVFAERIDRTEREFSSEAAIMQIVSFLRADTKRPLCLPRGAQEAQHAEEE